ncbi:MAG TPA: AI-2E family transporter [Fimbriiglobus sp.]|nr:AI-2E family transporter [Fimbriiglobus sp.]
MSNLADAPANGPPREEHVPRGWIHLAALAGLTLVGVYVCYRLVEPFLPAVAWAVALAIIAHPLNEWICRRVSSRTWSAVASTAVVVLVVVVPVLLVAEQLAEQARVASQQVRQMTAGSWQQAVARVPWLNDLSARVAAHVDVEQAARRAVAALLGDVGRVVTGSVWWLLQALVMVFILFFAFRDQDHLLTGLRRLLPVTRPEAEHLFTRTADAVHATVYAAVVTGAIQGATGGLLFWALGVPAPLLWGVVMFVLGILPIVGAFLVWAPVAVGLALADRWGAALVIVAWGVLMAGPINNYIYAWLAGGRLRLHPVPALLAFIGGLAVFGITGMVLGPVALAVTLALIDMWRQRAEPKPRPEPIARSLV